MIPLSRTLLTLGILFLVYLAGHINGCACSRANGKQTNNTDTVVVKDGRDTLILVLPSDSARLSEPTMARAEVPAKKDYSYPLPGTDTIFWTDGVPSEVFAELWASYDSLADRYASLEQVYNTRKFLRDTARFPGRANIYWSGLAYQNSVMGAQFTLDSFQQTHITRTVEKMVPKRNQVWLGMNGYYFPVSREAALSADVQFLHKRGIGVKGEAGFTLSGETFVGLGGQYLIQLRKR
jgi:hypothetical protein